MRRSTLIAGIVFAALNLSFVSTVAGHGDVVSRRGGVAVAAGEMTVEFVIARGKVSVYLNDHGDPVSIKGAQGTLVLGSAVSEDRAIPMRTGDDDGFEATDVAPERGDRIRFFAKMPDGQVHVAEMSAP